MTNNTNKMKTNIYLTPHTNVDKTKHNKTKQNKVIIKNLKNHQETTICLV